MLPIPLLLEKLVEMDQVKAFQDHKDLKKIREILLKVNIFIQSQTVTNVSSVIFSNLDGDKDVEYKIKLINCQSNIPNNFILRPNGDPSQGNSTDIFAGDANPSGNQGFSYLYLGGSA